MTQLLKARLTTKILKKEEEEEGGRKEGRKEWRVGAKERKDERDTNN